MTGAESAAPVAYCPIIAMTRCSVSG